MKVFGIFVFNFLLVALLIFGLSQVLGEFTTVRVPSPSLSTSPPPLPSFNILTLHPNEESRYIQSCKSKNCRTLTPPDSARDQAVTDGEYWYFYQYKEAETEPEILMLVRRHIATGKVTTILEQTPLAEPRGLYISPDNNKIAFWLDNTTDKNSDLTELWVYDTAEQGTTVIAEKLVRPAILTEPRWNRASSLIYLIGDNAEPGEEQRPELITVNLKPASVQVSFLAHNWGQYLTEENLPILDISADGKRIAYADRSFFRRQLVVLNGNGTKTHTSIRGNLVYAEWLPNQELIYIVSNNTGFTVWHHQNEEHSLIARYDTPLHSARTDVSKEYLVLLLAGTDKFSAEAVNIEYRSKSSLGHWPTLLPGAQLVHVEREQKQIAGAADYYEDDEIAAFIESHLGEITSDSTAVPERLIFTNIPNLIYLDYAVPHFSDRRLLISIRDIRLSEWATEAAFEDRAGEWQKLTGEKPKDLQTTRLYEWEPSVDQWILKKTN